MAEINTSAERRLIVYCLHGFLGLPSDWDFLEPQTAEMHELIKVDILKLLSPATGASPSDWADAFHATIPHRPPHTLRVLVGYSMGGRLALHALTQAPGLWDAAMIISADPGLSGPAERRERRVKDEAWARRFEVENWESVTKAWDRLPIFGERVSPFERQEMDYSRNDLAGALRAWSPGRQKNLIPEMSRLAIPLSSVAGVEDRKYVEISRQIQEIHSKSVSSLSETQLITQAGHRAPWENPSEFRQYFCGFLARILLFKSP